MNFAKYSGGTLILVEDFAARGSAALAVRTGCFGVSDPDPADGEAKVSVFLRCNTEASLKELPESFDIRPGRGEIRTAQVPISRIDQVAEHPDVNRIQISRYLKPHLDRAMPFLGVPAYRVRINSSGAGAIIGIIDSGIDGRHPSFAGRILRVWDQTKPGLGVLEGAGVELTGDAIREHATDETGHGTHIAGIAAGALAPFVGVAPEASLVIVKTTLNDTDIARAATYLTRIIRESGMPGVINMSFGAQHDAHDGTDELSILINSLAGPGVIFCTSAGNERLQKRHARVSTVAGQTVSIPFTIAGDVKLAVLNCWYPGADSLAIAIEAPDGSSTPFLPAVLEGDHQSSYLFDSVKIMVSTPGPNPNGDHHVHAEITPFTAALMGDGETWLLKIQAITIVQGVFDVWSETEDLDAGVAFQADVTQQMMIGAPGCAAEAITVGCFASRRDWISQDHLNRFGFVNVNVLAPESSPGPLRDQRRKPDFVTPGKVLISSRALNAPVSEGLRIDDNFKVDQGSSMSAGAATGIIALMLSREPALTTADVRARLTAASSIPGSPAGTYKPEWGYGLLKTNPL